MKKRINLNFDWWYNKDFNGDQLVDYANFDGFEKVNLPHSNVITPLNNFDEKMMQIISCYKKPIFIDKEDNGKIVEVVFEGSAHLSTIYVNDEFVEVHKGGYDRFIVDISNYLKYGEENVLTVVVDATENPNIPPFSNVIDYLCYGGLYREVYLDIAPEGRILDCFISTPNATDSVTAYCNVLVDKTPVDLELTLFDKGKVVSYNKYNINRESETINFDVKGRKLWSLNNPNLYDVVLKISNDGILLDEASYRFGYREVVFNKDGLYLNGEKIKILGLNRHQCYPYVGYAMPKSAQEKDADILKYELGVNTVRTSHYMQSLHFLNRCDEIGLLVLEEIPGWQTIGTDEFKRNTLVNVEKMIKRDYNHPSIIAWGVRVNESLDDSSLYKKTNQLAHHLDSTRPTFGVRHFLDSEFLEDVFTYNDFTHDGSDKVIAKPKKTPHLITEHTGHMYPTKRIDDEPHRLEHSLRHLRVVNAALGSDDIVGVIGWCMHDYNTHKEFGSGDKICYHGVLDMFRVPKLAASVYASQLDSKPYLEVASSLAKGDYPASRQNEIYVYTNCEYVKMFKNNDYVATYYPNKELYPNLPHPPVVIDDKVGVLLEKYEKVSKKDAKKIKKIFKIVDVKGFNVGLFTKLKVFKLMFKYHWKLNQFINLYYKYHLATNEEVLYRFDGYINENVATSVTISSVSGVKANVKVDSTILTVKDTYDVTRVVVTLRDENNIVAPYSFAACNVETSGGIDIIGPSNIALVGGVAAFYVKTNQTSSKGLIKVRVFDEEITQEVTINMGEENERN